MEWLIVLGIIGAIAVGWLVARKSERKGPRDGRSAPRGTKGSDDGGWRSESSGVKLLIPRETTYLPPMPAGASSTVPSLSEEGVEYEVDTASLTCSCPDFAKNRTHHAPNDLRRVCKHLRLALLDATEGYSVPPLIRAALEDEFLTSASYFFLRKIGNDEVIVSVKEGGEWVNVYAPETGQRTRKANSKSSTTRQKTYRRFGYSVIDERWSYDTRPASAPEVTRLVRSIVGVE